MAAASSQTAKAAVCACIVMAASRFSLQNLSASSLATTMPTTPSIARGPQTAADGWETLVRDAPIGKLEPKNKKQDARHRAPRWQWLSAGARGAGATSSSGRTCGRTSTARTTWVMR
eukprot:scaffold12393_cov105-Isochrysis_galbana.AAC.6